MFSQFSFNLFAGKIKVISEVTIFNAFIVKWKVVLYCIFLFPVILYSHIKLNYILNNDFLYYI